MPFRDWKSMYVYEKDTGNKIPAGMCSVTIPTGIKILSEKMIKEISCLLTFYNSVFIMKVTTEIQD